MNRYLPQTIFKPNGQISRAQFWLGAALINGAGFGFTRVVEGSFFPDTFTLPAAELASTLVLLVLETILVSNRLRDLRWPTWFVIPLTASVAAFSAAAVYNAIPGSIEAAASIYVVLVLAAELIVCGMLPGRAHVPANGIRAPA